MKKTASDPDISTLLVKLGVVQPGELSELPGLQACLADPETALTLAAGVRQRLGELLIDAKRLVEEQITEALDEQGKTGGKLGDVLVRLGYLSLAERDLVLEFQRRQGGEAPTSDQLRLGRILVSTGEISERQLEEALEHKRLTGRRIGEELVAKGQLSAERLRHALALQHRLVIAALIAGLSSVGSLYVKPAKAAQARASMSVTATVVDSVSIRIVHQAQDLVITEQDAARGYIEVPAASRFEIRNKGPCMFDFRAVGNLFRSVKVTLPEGAAEFGPGGGTMLQRPSVDPGQAHVEVGYRFELASGVSSGTYTWPVALTVLPM